MMTHFLRTGLGGNEGVIRRGRGVQVTGVRCQGGVGKSQPTRGQGRGGEAPGQRECRPPTDGASARAVVVLALCQPRRGFVTVLRTKSER